MYPIFVVNLGLHTQTSKDLGDNRSREHAPLPMYHHHHQNQSCHHHHHQIVIIIIIVKIIPHHQHRGQGFGKEIFFPLKEVLQDQRWRESKGLGHVHLLPRTAQLGRMEKHFPKKSFPVFLKHGQLYFSKATESISSD